MSNYSGEDKWLGVSPLCTLFSCHLDHLSNSKFSFVASLFPSFQNSSSTSLGLNCPLFETEANDVVVALLALIGDLLEEYLCQSPFLEQG